MSTALRKSKSSAASKLDDDLNAENEARKALYIANGKVIQNYLEGEEGGMFWASVSNNIVWLKFLNHENHKHSIFRHDRVMLDEKHVVNRVMDHVRRATDEKWFDESTKRHEETMARLKENRKGFNPPKKIDYSKTVKEIMQAQDQNPSQPIEGPPSGEKGLIDEPIPVL